MKLLLFSVCAFLLSPVVFADESAEFQYPLAVTATEDGIVYVADRTLPGIWKIEDGKKSVFFQASKKFRTPLNAVRCLAIDHEGRLLAGDSATRDVYRFDEAGQPQPLTDGWIGIPMALAVAADGTIYTADLELHRIWKMPAAGATQPEEFAVINSPRGLTLDGDGNLVVLSTSSKDGQIQKVAPDGTITPFVKGHPFNLPHNVVIDGEGSLFVTDNYAHCVWKVAADGTKTQWVTGEPLDRPVGLCRSGDNLLIADPHIRTIFSLAPDKTLTVFASSPGDEK
ncbi:MAG: NHL repeat-containing protein [Planctomycetaceae bacterium]|nr:NHL repeat-containing protein [Planctomycetaceae bacterium]